MPRAKKNPDDVPDTMILPRPTPHELAAMIAELSGDTRFQLYVEQIKGIRERAILDLCNDEVVGSPTKMAAGIGEIRALSDILALTDQHIRNG